MSSDLPARRIYQDEAIAQGVSRGNLLLAMTMGSGKTRVAIDIVGELAERGSVSAGAVFVLNSTKFQWQREIELWAPGSTVQVIDGIKSYRTQQYRKAHRYRYTILNYEALIHDWELIQQFLPIDFVVADEVTAIKSFTAKKSKRLKMIGKYAPYRYGLSGQPVENRPEELFSIMEFIDKAVLGPFHRFDRTFITRDHWGKPKWYRNLDTLADTLKDAMFRRSRADIAAFLPSLLSIETPVPLDSWSQSLYDEIREDLLDVLDMAISAGMGGFDLVAHYGKSDAGGEANKFKGMIMSRVTCMRLLCGHPALLIKSAQDYDEPDSPSGSAYASEMAGVNRLNQAPKSSTKLVALMDAVDYILSESDFNKVVVFSGFKAMLALIAVELKKANYGHTLLTGDVPAAERDKRIVRFNTDHSCRVFLSSDAGAYGVNLPAGSHLISYDLPWSAGLFAQRMSRIDRTSSEHASIIIDSMYAANTIEERQYDMLVQKRKIAEAFIDGRYDPKGELRLDLSSLREFLTK